MAAALLVDRLSTPSLAALALAIALGLIGIGVLFGQRVSEPSRIAWQLAQVVVAVLGIASLIRTPYLFAEQSLALRFAAGVLNAALVIVAFMMTSPQSRQWLRAAALSTFLIFGSMSIAADPGRDIDVVIFQQLGSQHLLDGVNPYRATYPNLYPPAETEIYYGPGLAVGDELRFGFPYTPMSLFMAVPGYALAGDYRYGLLASGGVLLWILTRPDNGRLGSLAGGLFLVFPFHSGVGGMLGRGWTEPFVCLLLALVVLSTARKSRWIPEFFGLLLASKLTLIVIAPLYFLIDGAVYGKHGRASRIFRVGFSGALVTLPLAIPGWSRFWFSVVELQFLQPVRYDALSFTVWLSRLSGSAPPAQVFTVVPFLAAVVALVLVFRAADSTPEGLALSSGFVAFAWLVMTKQSFLNHYYFVVMAILVGIAFSGDAETGLEQPRQKETSLLEGRLTT